MNGLTLVVSNATEALLYWDGPPPPEPFGESTVPRDKSNNLLLCHECLDLLRYGSSILFPIGQVFSEAARHLRVGGRLELLSDRQSLAVPGALCAEYGFVETHREGACWKGIKQRTINDEAPVVAPEQTHRLPGYALLNGTGFEIGAFNDPAPLPAAASVSYFDAIDEVAAAKLFPEINPASFVHVTHIGDVDRGGLLQFEDSSRDFVVCNHVIEHVANPIELVRQLFRIVRRGGFVVLAAPDKRFTFDFERAITTFEHLREDFEQGVSANSDDHYWDFLRHVTPHVFQETVENQRLHLARARERREHAHVWDSPAFRQFVSASLQLLGVSADSLYESIGDENKIEYFGVWQKR